MREGESVLGALTGSCTGAGTDLAATGDAGAAGDWDAAWVLAEGV